MSHTDYVSQYLSKSENCSRLIMSTDTHSDGGSVNYIAAHIAWVNANKTSRNIAAYLHAGDFTNGDMSAQWSPVQTAWATLSVPGVAVPGNHDYQGSDYTTRTTDLSTYVPTTSMSALIATFQDNVSSNTAHVVTINGRSWLILGLELWPRDAVVTWAKGLLTTHAEKTAVIVTHECVTRTGVLSTQAYYSLSTSGIAMGVDINENLVLPHSNVRLVLSGHDTPYGVARVTTVRPDFSRCNFLYRNFQGFVGGSGGAPFLTEIVLDEVNNQCRVSAWSPSLGSMYSAGSETFQLT